MAAYYDPADYVATVQDVAFVSAKSGKPMIVFQVRVDAMLKVDFGPDGERHETTVGLEKNWTRTIRLCIHDDVSVEWALKKLAYAGFDSAKITDVERLVGKQVRCVCDHGEYNGEPSEQWDLMLPPISAEPLESDDSVARKIQTLMAASLKKNARTATPPPKVPETAPPVPDDELPF